jgi:hypothetical protein
VNPEPRPVEQQFAGVGFYANVTFCRKFIRYFMSEVLDSQTLTDAAPDQASDAEEDVELAADPGIAADPDSDQPRRPSSTASTLRRTLPPLQAAPIHKSRLLRQFSEVADPPVDSLEDLSNYVRIYEAKHHRELVLNRHEKAAAVRHQLENFADHARRSLYRRKCHSSLSDLGNRLSTTGCDRENLHDDMATRLDEFEDEAEERVQNLIERQNAEWEKHLATRPDDTPANFRRRSPQLLELARQERRLFFQSRFAEADVIRRECEIRDAKEAEEANRQAFRHWNAVGAQLEEKFRVAFARMQYWIETRREEIMRDRNFQDDAIQKREALLNYEIDGTQTALKRQVPKTVIRSLLFDKPVSRGTVVPVKAPLNIDKMCAELTPTAKRVLLRHRR